MSWVGPESDGVHLPVPKELKDEAVQKAKASLENFD
jgi:20S proteasome subunit alpha 7